MQTIWVYSLMYNERMILPFYLRHYEQFADRIIIYDHDSNDGSLELARAHPKVSIRDWSAPGIYEPMVTEFYNTVYYEARGRADWVIMVDMDEFVYYFNDLRGALSHYKNSGVEIPTVAGYTMLHDCAPLDCGNQIWQDCPYGVRDRKFDKYAVFQPHVEINYDHGRHRANPSGKIGDGLSIKLLHYRYWGEAWVKERHATHASRLHPVNISRGWGENKTKDDGSYYTPNWFKKVYPARSRVV
jgi:hypothetical protein